MENLNHIYKKSPDIVFRRIGQECLLVPIRKNVADLNFIYSFNPVSAFIWESLDGVKPLSVLLSDLVTSFDVPEAVAAEDLSVLISQLLSEGLIMVNKG